MNNIVKSQPSPICLEKEKQKKNGTYLCGDTYERISKDFFGKCYICEDNKPTSINVEHFEPHFNGKNNNKKFDWNNLFFACSHCNNIKGSTEKEILNCTNSEHKITEWIKFEIKPFPKELQKISSLTNEEIVKNTVNLLNLVYNYKFEENVFTSTKEAANNLRHRLLVEIDNFGKLLREYYNEDENYSYEKEIIKRKIKKQISSKSAFSAFKLWIIKENITYKKDFLD